MKRNTMRKIFMIVALVGMLCGLNVSTVWAVEYLGEFCWKITTNEDTAGAITPSSVIGKFAVTQTGDNYYLLQGKTNARNPTYFIGSGIIAGNNLIITMNNTYETADPVKRETRIANWTLDLGTLSGTNWRTTTRFDTTTRTISQIYNAGSVEFVTCP